MAKHRNGPTATVVTAFQGTTHASWICTGGSWEMAVRFRKGRSRVRALRVWESTRPDFVELQVRGLSGRRWRLLMSSSGAEVTQVVSTTLVGQDGLWLRSSSSGVMVHLRYRRCSPPGHAGVVDVRASCCVTGCTRRQAAEM